MKYIKNILIVSSLLMFIACNDYLDLVPEDDIMTEETIFETEANAYKFLATCYDGVEPMVGDPNNDPAIFGADEFVTNELLRSGRVGTVKQLQAFLLADGRQNTLDPYFNIWGETSNPFWYDIDADAYESIRNCNTFIANIDKVYNMTNSEKLTQKAEAIAVKAFYYFELIKRYGPICLIPESLGVGTDIITMQVPRSHIDTCFNRVVRLLDEAIPYLDDIDSHDTHRKQTMCKEAAYALRARARLYQASPLFNGNSWYSQFTNRDGEPLFTSEYDASKWKNAADAATEALDVCIQNGRKLEKDYQVDKTSLLNKMYDINTSTLSPGFVGSEWLWLYQSNEPDARNGALLPRNTYNGSSTAILGNVNPSMRMIEMFYTENGLPIDKDKTWAYSQRYSLMKEYDPKYDGVVALETNIPGVNLKREPRFYADLIFDKSYFAYSYTFLVNAKKGEKYGNTYNYSQADNIQNMTGYWCKKLTPENVSEGVPQYSVVGFPIFRLAELYLNYAEALNEYSGPSQEVYDAIDVIRDRAGILPVVKAWKEYSSEPNKVTTKEGMRDIIHRERTIEFAFEGYRYWDLRRWKEAEVLNEDRYGWNTFGDTEESYYNYGRGPIVVWSENKFESPRDYFFPIRSDETVTANIKQNLYW